MMSSKLAFASVALLAPLVACASSDGDTTNGVNDVKQACEIRATWAHANSSACTECLGFAASPRCDCDRSSDSAGRCSGQADAKRAEPSCDDALIQCIGACDAADCACIDACYVGKDACRARASALDGCLADICASDCQ